jgi:hypothetical protein
MARAKRAAKSLQRQLSVHGEETSLPSCQNVVARMYGYAHWHELTSNVGKADPSPDDETSDQETIDRRFAQQIQALTGRFPAQAARAAEIVRAVGATSSRVLAGTKHFLGEIKSRSFAIFDEEKLLFEEQMPLPFEVFFNVLQPDVEALLEAAVGQNGSLFYDGKEDDGAGEALVEALVMADLAGKRLSDVAGAVLRVLGDDAAHLIETSDGKRRRNRHRMGEESFEIIHSARDRHNHIPVGTNRLADALWQCGVSCERIVSSMKGQRGYLPLERMIDGLMKADEIGADPADLAVYVARVLYSPGDRMDPEEFGWTGNETANMMEIEGAKSLGTSVLTVAQILPRLKHIPIHRIPDVARRHELYDLWHLEFLDHINPRGETAWRDDDTAGVFLEAHRQGFDIRDLIKSMLALVRHESGLDEHNYTAWGGTPVAEIMEVLKRSGTVPYRVAYGEIDVRDQLRLLVAAHTSKATLEDLAYLVCWRTLLLAPIEELDPDVLRATLEAKEAKAADIRARSLVERSKSLVEQFAEAMGRARAREDFHKAQEAARDEQSQAPPPKLP